VTNTYPPPSAITQVDPRPGFAQVPNTEKRIARSGVSFCVYRRGQFFVRGGVLGFMAVPVIGSWGRKQLMWINKDWREVSRLGVTVGGDLPW